jgi:hypothetical protein
MDYKQNHQQSDLWSTISKIIIKVIFHQLYAKYGKMNDVQVGIPFCSYWGPQQQLSSARPATRHMFSKWTIFDQFVRNNEVCTGASIMLNTRQEYATPPIRKFFYEFFFKWCAVMRIRDRIRIRIGNTDPDQGGPKWPSKCEENSSFEVLDGLFWLLREEDFSCSSNVLYEVLGITV